MTVFGSQTARPFRLRKASFKGEGHSRELRDADWQQLRDLAYEGGAGDLLGNYGCLRNRK